jgi:Rad3-related DNA helicase
LLEYSDIIYLPYSSILNPDIRNRIGININNAIIVFDEGHNVLEFEKQLHSPEILFEDIEVLTQQLD